ncbi:MAG: MATE family efflux transporter [Bryobacteraceae bacterium]
MSLWTSVKESLAGSHRDYTEGPIGRAIFLLAIPMVLEMSMESLFAVVDVFFVAKLGSDAVASVGLTESVMTLMFAIAMGLAIATTAMVARRIGEKDPEGAAIASVQSLALGTVIAAIIGLLGFLFAHDILRLMGASDSIVRTGTGYTRAILGGSFTVFMLFLINASFRGAGDAAIAMRVLIIANSINILLNPCLIFGWGPFPALGVTGSGIGTTIGRGTGVLYGLWRLYQGSGHLRLQRRHVSIVPEVMGRLLRMSLSAMFQYFIAVASWMAMVRMAASFGSAAIAGYTVAIRIVIFAILPSWGLSNAAATLVGQNLGAGKPDRAEASVWRAGLYNMAFLGSVGVAFLIFAPFILGLFTQDADVLRYGVSCLRIMAVGYAFYGWGMVMVQSFNGAGDTLTPTIINFFCYWMFQIPLAYGLAFWSTMGISGVFWAIPIAESALALCGVIAFRRGKWKTQKV